MKLKKLGEKIGITVVKIYYMKRNKAGKRGKRSEENLSERETYLVVDQGKK